MRKKRGTFELQAGTIVGFVIGIVLVLIIVMVMGKYWVLFPQKSVLDHDSSQYFQLVYSESLKVYESEKDGNDIPVQFKEGTALVAFSKENGINCLGATRPEKKECQGTSCICLCDLSAGGEMCNTAKAVCEGYDRLDLNYDKEKCNVVEGTGTPKYVKVVYGKKGISFEVSSPETLA